MPEEARIEQEAAAGAWLTVAAVKFIMTVSRSTHHTEFYESEIGEMIHFAIVPFVMLRDEDKELFEKNYVVFVRLDIEGCGVDTRTGIACNLLKEISTKYKKTVTERVSSLARFGNNPAANWEHKECATYLVVSVFTDLVNVDGFFESIIVLESRNRDVNEVPMLIAGALKLFTRFRKHISKCIALPLIPDLVRFLGSESNVVRSYAANCIKQLLSVKRGKKGIYGSSDISPFSPGLMTNLFGALRKPKSDQNPYVLKCITRVLEVADISRKVASPCITGLTSVLIQVMHSPNNPTFNGYLFEAVGVLVRRSWEKDPSLQRLAQLCSSYDAAIV